MHLTGVICPQCGKKTDASPCWNCGYEFVDQETLEELEKIMHNRAVVNKKRE